MAYSEPTAEEPTKQPRSLGGSIWPLHYNSTHLCRGLHNELSRRRVQRRFRRRAVIQLKTGPKYIKINLVYSHGLSAQTSSTRWPSRHWVQSTPPLTTSSARSDGASRLSVDKAAKHHFSIGAFR